MKAIAKYLPVEGEIKALDKIDGKDFVNPAKYPNDFKDEMGNYWRMISDDEAQLHKPFAVTQDIEVGNEIAEIIDGAKTRYFDVVDIIENTVVTDYTLMSGGITCKKENCYKILGKLSLDAQQWVEDGGEYEVMLAYSDEDIAAQNRIGYDDIENYYKAKCHICKTYH